MARRHALIVGERPGIEITEALSRPDSDYAGGVTYVDDDRSWSDTTVDELDLDGLDLVVHCRYPALARRKRDLVDLSAADWAVACDEPLEAAIRLARGAHPHLAARAGTIVFLVPLMASAGGEGFTPFATAAEGIRIMAKSLAKTWGPDGITAHAITLDPHAFLDEADAEGIAEANSLHDPPLGHVPDSDDVASIIRWLAGDPANALTGASLVVDGGLWMPG